MMGTKRGIGILLTLMLAFGLVTTAFPASALADGDTKAVVLGTDILDRDQTVWFGGKSATEPFDTSWVVLDNDSGKAFLVSGRMMENQVRFNQLASSDWAGSEAQNWCINFYDNWPSALSIEKGAILPTSKEEKNDKTEDGVQYYYKTMAQGLLFGAAPLDNEHFFFLSAEELDHIPFYDQNAFPSGGGSQFWPYWTRSPEPGDSSQAGMQDGGSGFEYQDIGDSFGARPAFHLDLSAVLFLSDAGSAKSSSSTLAAVPTGKYTDWKLTLKDGSRKFTADTTPVSAAPGGEISIPYQGAKTGDQERISVMLCDGTAVKYYGSVPAKTASGTAKFTLPGDVAGGKTYTLKVFNEAQNAQHLCDYASAMTDIRLTVDKREVDPEPVPKTGDASRPAIWAGLLLLSAGAVSATTVMLNRSRRKES